MQPQTSVTSLHVTELSYDLFISLQAALHNQQPSSSCTQREKLEKLESEYLKLSKTQTMAEVILFSPVH